MLDTLRFRLLLILVLFSACTITVTVISFRYFVKSKDSVSEVTQRIESTQNLLLKDINVMHNFFENETINPSFFATGKSLLLETHMTLCKNINKSLDELYELQRINHFELNDSLMNFKVTFNKYDKLANDMVSNILLRGFKDYGTEGRMRKHAHALEEYEKEIGLINILQLRRHEKDFIIRQEDQYVALHLALISYLQTALTENKNIGDIQKQEIAIVLSKYSAGFKTLVHYERKLGLKNGSGLKKQIDGLSEKLETALSSMVEVSKLKEVIILNHIKLAYVIAGLLFLLISFIFAGIISKKAVKSITYLKDKIDEFVTSGFSKRTILPITDSTNEIDMLSTNFSIMEQHIVDQMNSLKQTNKDLEMLFYATSHDMQLPLLEVKNLTESAITEVSDPRSQEYFSKVNASWEQLINIIDELGIITNVRNVEIKPELINPENLIRSIFSEFRSMDCFDTIIFSLDIKLETKFYSSVSLLKIIFRNLIENAIKYSAKRTSFSFLKITISNENTELIKVMVSDNGIGIKKEFQEKIFDMFYRGTHYTSGTGLGLYIVKNSLEKIDGAISVYSEEGMGTTFTLLIPNTYKEKNTKEKIIHKRGIGELQRVIN